MAWGQTEGKRNANMDILRMIHDNGDNASCIDQE